MKNTAIESDRQYDLIRSYDLFAEWFYILQSVYYKPAQTNKIGAFILERKADAKNLLDCACGIGSMGIDLVSMGFSVTFSDASAEMLKHAKKLPGERKKIK